VCLAVFLARCVRHRSPVLELALLCQPNYAVTNAVTVLFATAFGAMLLSVVLWAQEDWGWSALRTGLSVAPGPLMVPLFSVVAGRLISKVGPRGVIATGCAVFAAGVMWWRGAVGIHPDYVGSSLGGMLVTGVGVGLTLPTLFSTAAASLPPSRFATGSAVISMARQLGFVIGVAVLVAVLGTSSSEAGKLRSFEHGWTAIAAMAVLGALTVVLLYRPVRTPVAGAATSTEPVRAVEPALFIDQSLDVAPAHDVESGV
jgi:MFS family permease